MNEGMLDRLKEETKQLSKKGLFKHERILKSPQGREITLSSGKKVINFCANNYLGLSNNNEIIEAAAETMKKWGYGLSSVRFICGTQEIHIALEEALTDFLGTEATILYAACFDANGGLFEPLLREEDAIISDELNHASIIDGVRLCKARRFRYKHSDMDDLEKKLQEAKQCRNRLICTDGVFSMDGDIARLKDICALAKKYDALTMVDDSHATGYIGKNGKGTPEYCGVEDEVHIITTTFGKALGGASGGCVSGKKEIVDFLRQRSRPYLFSNTLPPAVAGGTLKALELMSSQRERREKLIRNAEVFRKGMKDAGFRLIPGETAIVPIMLDSEPLTEKMADRLLDEGIYVIGFSYPVVPLGKTRIRVQLSAEHEPSDITEGIQAFTRVGKELGILH